MPLSIKFSGSYPYDFPKKKYMNKLFRRESRLQNGNIIIGAVYFRECYATNAHEYLINTIYMQIFSFYIIIDLSASGTDVRREEERKTNMTHTSRFLIRKESSFSTKKKF